MLPAHDLEKIRAHLESARDPLFLFDDDPDGLCGFLLLARSLSVGTGKWLKARPQITDLFVSSVKSENADVIFILDISNVDQEFIDAVGVPIVWLDHHEVQLRERVNYFNPLLHSTDYVPTSRMCYGVVQKDLWLAMIGCLADYHFPPFADEFRSEFPDLLPAEISTITDAIYKSPIGKLIRVLSFNLKGEPDAVSKSISALKRIASPREILDQSSDDGAFVWKRFLSINSDYEALRDRAMRVKPVKGLWVFTYETDANSLTKDLANEMCYRLPQNIVVLGRLNKVGEYRCSLRSSSDIPLREVLKAALIGIHGQGGGHAHACGASVRSDDFGTFIENMRRELALVVKK